MADTVTIDAAGTATQPADSGGGKDPKFWSIPGSPGDLPEVTVGRVYLNHNRYVPPRRQFFGIKAGDTLTLTGDGLDAYNQAVFLDDKANGRKNQEPVINQSYGNRVIATFTVPDLGDFTGLLRLRLTSENKSFTNRTIDEPKLMYFAETEEEKKNGFNLKKRRLKNRRAKRSRRILKAKKLKSRRQLNLPPPPRQLIRQKNRKMKARMTALKRGKQKKQEQKYKNNSGLFCRKLTNNPRNWSGSILTSTRR